MSSQNGILTRQQLFNSQAHCCSGRNIQILTCKSKRAFQKAELAGRTIARPDILAMK